MNKVFFKSLLLKTTNPGRVACGEYNREKGITIIFSAENKNDTFDWFHVNSSTIEKGLQEKGLSWCYVFETTPQSDPFIYMFIGKNITKDSIEDEIKDSKETLEDGREFYFEDEPFMSIDAEKYNNGRTLFEDLLFNKASDVLRVYEP